MTKIVCLNGHIGSGKDVAAKALQPLGFENRKLSDPLTHAVRNLFDIEEYHGVKDRVYEEAFGRTFRHWQIAVAKMLHKESLYRGPLAHILIRSYPKDSWDKVVISDLGRTEELEVLVAKFGAENILLISIASTTDPHRFLEAEKAIPVAPTDDRKYVSVLEARTLGITTRKVSNDYTDKFKGEIIDAVQEWLLTKEEK